MKEIYQYFIEKLKEKGVDTIVMAESIKKVGRNNGFALKEF